MEGLLERAGFGLRPGAARRLLPVAAARDAQADGVTRFAAVDREIDVAALEVEELFQAVFEGSSRKAGKVKPRVMEAV